MGEQLIVCGQHRCLPRGEWVVKGWEGWSSAAGWLHQPLEAVTRVGADEHHLDQAVPDLLGAVVQGASVPGRGAREQADRRDDFRVVAVDGVSVEGSQCRANIRRVAVETPRSRQRGPSGPAR